MTKRILDCIAKFEVRKGEYDIQAVNFLLAEMNVLIKDDSWLPALQARLSQPPREAAPVEYKNDPEPACTDIVVSETATHHALQSTASTPEELTLLLHTRDQEISTLKEQLKLARADLRNSQRRFDRLKQRSDLLVKHCGEPEEPLAIKKRNGHKLVRSSIYAVAIQRNFSNIAAADLGAVLLTDLSRQTVVRSEVAAGAALLGSAIAFWKAEMDALDQPEWSFSVTSFTADATGAGMWKRKKISTCEMETTILLRDVGGNGELASMKRQCDLVPVKHCTGEGTLGVIDRHVRSVGAPSWRDSPRNDSCMRVWLCTSDRGPDQVSVRKMMHAEIEPLVNVLFLDFDCIEHALHLIIKSSIFLVDSWLSSAGRSFKYFPALTNITQIWRENAQEVRDEWALNFGEVSAKNKKTCQ